MCNCPCDRQSFIPNPDQFLMFDELEPVKAEGYLQGFELGLRWDASWMPGGPNVYNGKLKELRKRDKAHFESWHKGFNDGLATRLHDNPHFAKWWEYARKQRGYLRYSEPESLTH